MFALISPAEDDDRFRVVWSVNRPELLKPQGTHEDIKSHTNQPMEIEKPEKIVRLAKEFSDLFSQDMPPNTVIFSYDAANGVDLPYERKDVDMLVRELSRYLSMPPEILLEFIYGSDRQQDWSDAQIDTVRKNFTALKIASLENHQAKKLARILDNKLTRILGGKCWTRQRFTNIGAAADNKMAKALSKRPWLRSFRPQSDDGELNGPIPGTIADIGIVGENATDKLLTDLGIDFSVIDNNTTGLNPDRLLTLPGQVDTGIKTEVPLEMKTLWSLNPAVIWARIEESSRQNLGFQKRRQQNDGGVSWVHLVTDVTKFGVLLQTARKLRTALGYQVLPFAEGSDVLIVRAQVFDQGKLKADLLLFAAGREDSQSRWSAEHPWLDVIYEGTAPFDASRWERVGLVVPDIETWQKYSQNLTLRAEKLSVSVSHIIEGQAPAKSILENIDTLIVAVSAFLRLANEDVNDRTRETLTEFKNLRRQIVGLLDDKQQREHLPTLIFALSLNSMKIARDFLRGEIDRADDNVARELATQADDIDENIVRLHWQSLTPKLQQSYLASGYLHLLKDQWSNLVAHQKSDAAGGTSTQGLEVAIAVLVHAYRLSRVNVAKALKSSDELGVFLKSVVSHANAQLGSDSTLEIAAELSTDWEKIVACVGTASSSDQLNQLFTVHAKSMATNKPLPIEASAVYYGLDPKVIVGLRLPAGQRFIGKR